jgi:uncharacterized membrane protein YqjE
MTASGPEGLMSSLRRLAATLAGIVQARLELLSNDAEEAALLLWHLLLLGALCLFCFGTAAVLFSAWLVVLLWDSHPAAALSGLMVLYLAGGVIALYWFRNRKRSLPRLFSASLAELATDRKHLIPPS